MFRPRHDQNSKIQVRVGLEAVQAALLNQVVTELAKPRASLVVAEAWSGNHA